MSIQKYTVISTDCIPPLYHLTGCLIYSPAGFLESLYYESLDACEPCLMGKMTKTPFSGTMEQATDLLEIIHTDVCVPMNIKACSRYHYFLTFTDDLSRYGYIYLMKHKSEMFEKFKEFQSEVENHRDKKIKFLRSDRGDEYLSYEFGLQLKQCEIVSLLMPPGTPQHNGAPNVIIVLYWIKYNL